MLQTVTRECPPLRAASRPSRIWRRKPQKAILLSFVVRRYAEYRSSPKRYTPAGISTVDREEHMAEGKEEPTVVKRRSERTVPQEERNAQARATALNVQRTGRFTPYERAAKVVCSASTRPVPRPTPRTRVGNAVGNSTWHSRWVCKGQGQKNGEIKKGQRRVWLQKRQM